MAVQVSPCNTPPELLSLCPFNSPVGEGIAYTVLSRARESKHLYVENFRKEHVQVHMEALKSVQILSVEALGPCHGVLTAMP